MKLLFERSITVDEARIAKQNNVFNRDPNSIINSPDINEIITTNPNLMITALEREVRRLVSVGQIASVENQFLVDSRIQVMKNRIAYIKNLSTGSLTTQQPSIASKNLEQSELQTQTEESKSVIAPIERPSPTFRDMLTSMRNSFSQNKNPKNRQELELAKPTEENKGVFSINTPEVQAVVAKIDAENSQKALAEKFAKFAKDKEIEHLKLRREFFAIECAKYGFMAIATLTSGVLLYNNNQPKDLENNPVLIEQNFYNTEFKAPETKEANQSIEGFTVSNRLPRSFEKSSSQKVENAQVQTSTNITSPTESILNNARQMVNLSMKGQKFKITNTNK